MKRFLQSLLGMCMAFALGSACAIEIVSPQAEATVHDNSGKVAVTVDPGPDGLKAGQRIRLLLDGRPAADEADGLIQLAGVDRGMHRLQAELLDAQGQRVAVSDPVVFHMWRASKNFPARKR